FRWQRVAAVARSRPVIVAGGLTSANVGDCVRAARPWGVDVRGGIESGGRKSEELMRAFIGAVRAADAA
ncbi:MAG: phosphoribosylanthranilate isomerase, partial [Candidatus Eremiobacteraeota bacterium]|nr:phosphoribosylanthranilate isomerase [Candidatus Eremiobacteraeota bacterium]